jgi:hypothetical protein
MSILFLYAIYFNVRLIKTSMERASFTYEDQALAQSIITELDNLENEKFADTVRRHLQSEDAALYTDISQLEEALTKTDLSDESQETKSKLYKFILKSITSTLKEKLPLTNTPQSMARLIAVRAIGMQDGMFSENPEKKNHWLTCLKALQSECNDSTSPLITEFLEFRFTDNTNLFQSLSAGCFFELLCDPNLANPFCLSLYKKMTLQKPNTYLFPSHLQD